MNLTPRLLVVIVLYRAEWDRSAAFTSLCEPFDTSDGKQCGANILILLYDNAPGGDPSPEGLPPGVIYQAAARNDGVAGAYNFALELAVREGYDWILTLDQDTRVPPDYLLRMLSVASGLETVWDVGAIVPHLRQGDAVLSPVRVRPWGVHYLPLQSGGFHTGEVHAFNSGALFRRDALLQIGGFDDRFWLDYQESSVYRRLHRCAKRVYIADGLVLEHELSLISDQPISPARYHNHVLAESAYYDMYRGPLARLVLTGKSAWRVCKLFRSGSGPEIRRLARNGLMRRLFRSRKARTEEWRTDLSRRMPGAEAAWARRSNDIRPRLSVCMAAYNGSRYITAQLESILSQLAPDDEVVIVDDASNDQTIDKILDMRDPRIRLYRHSVNSGVLRTFEDAIRAASGRIIFLSDQDDLWDPRKVVTVLEAFNSHPDVSLVATDNALIDATGALISESYFASKGPFRQGLCANLIRNRFGGCTMAFRADILSDVLPLPHGYDVLHDIWIGVRNSLSGHKSLYIAKPLVLNRRHATTATGRERLTLSHRVRLRLHLLLALANFPIRKAVALTKVRSHPEAQAAHEENSSCRK
jgi:GT2 family glycosyltransferase